ncbi:alpha/beta fold hydrolase [Acidipila rosea]|uniref:Proline iminopeptidase n=1 Tax=Acidipila rosea TaxID=768535 RepID=A0A4R1L8U3_9BACT|nr:alpha/beta hydrolase [Acidipila rosea]TCK73620.1 proline iminopeptidase [Acidipila rosea]
MIRFAFLLLFSWAAIAQPTAPVTGTVHTPDVDLAYEVYGAAGSATPVIAVNGGPGLSHKYMLQNDVWTRLSRTRQIVFYDQRGTGKSQHMKSDASQGMDAQVADLDAVRSHLGFDKVDLVGDSYGGLLSMAYVVAHPEHVRRLVLSDSAPPAWKEIVHLLPDVFPDIEEQDAAIQKKLGDTDAAAQAQLLNHFRMIFYSEDRLHAYLAGIGDLGYTPKIGAAVSKATADIDLTSDLPKFNLPTLVITGRYDMNVAPLTAWRMYKAIPGAQLVIFSMSGHLPSYEEPDKYVKVVNSFLAAP